MDSTEILGIIAGIMTTISFIPQVMQILKTRNVEGISLLMYTIFTSGVFLWTLYGLIRLQISVIVANGVTLLLALIILGMKLWFTTGNRANKKACKAF